MSEQPSMHENDGAALLGERYTVGRLLGRGGMAEIYQGYDVLLDRDVAIKLLPWARQGDPELRRELRHEARAAALLNHPHVVAVYDIRQGPDAVFIVMEYLDGETLHRYLLRQGPLAPGPAVTIAMDVCSALEAAHAHGLVHRDITPSNVMLCRRGPAKVMDFGIAYVSGEEWSARDGHVMGTAAYLSPEQAQGRQIDGRSDIYSLGCCLYRMLTGAIPFTGTTAVEVARRHVRDHPPEPRAIEPDIPAVLENVVLRAMAKRPDDRYQSASELMDALDRGAPDPPTRTASVPGSAVPTPWGDEPGATVMSSGTGDLAAAGRSPRIPRPLGLALLVLMSVAILAALAVALYDTLPALRAGIR